MTIFVPTPLETSKGKALTPGQQRYARPVKQLDMLQIELRKLSDLKPHPDNPRKPKPGSIPQLAESIKGNPNYFEARPIILSNRTGELVIIDGERRSEAARFLGLQEVPTILMEGLTYDEELEILIKGNTHTGIWDNRKLEKFNTKPLANWGLTEKLKKQENNFEKEFNSYDNSNCHFPMIPVADEKHELFVIVSSSAVDSNWLREVFGMQRMKSYKGGLENLI